MSGVYDASSSSNSSSSSLSSSTAMPISISDLSLYTMEEKRILRILAITFASLSIISGILMLYWYTKLQRRTFRHTLIMGLICSDMLRSTLEFTYPLVSFVSGDISADSKYCQVSGFFTAFLFEASDLMVFIIAIHTTIYVFNPKLMQTFDEGGLWQWRYYVFFAWITIPGLLAGLAFINPTAYVPLVTWCYLPARPLVWRYALSWGPRYFILLTISVLYVALYAYVRRVYRTIDPNQLGDTSSSEIDSQSSVPRTSHCVGRYDPSQYLPYPKPVYLQQKEPSTPQPRKSEEDSHPAMSISSSEMSSPASKPSIIQHSTLSSFSSRPTLRNATTATSRNLFLTTLTHALPPSVRNPPLTPRDATLTFDQRRARVERQIRNLFIFPIVYFIMWMPPFINHLYQVTYYSNAKSPPAGTFVVTLLATIFLTSQGFINVCVYAVGEQPWRKYRRLNQTPTIPLSRSGTFIDPRVSHHEKLDDDSLMVVIQAQIDQAKLEHVKMPNALQAAYARRDIERGERELAKANQISDGRPQRSNWWDAQDDMERSVT